MPRRGGRSQSLAATVRVVNAALVAPALAAGTTLRAGSAKERALRILTHGCVTVTRGSRPARAHVVVLGRCHEGMDDALTNRSICRPRA
eukprot:scaffold3898_cov401-Prasinococcus_capsulatus_cf.AAC.8